MRYVDCSLVLNYVRLLRGDIPAHDHAVRVISNYFNIPAARSESAGELANWLAPRIFRESLIQYTGWRVTDASDEIVIVASEGSELLPILAYEPSAGSVPREDLRARAARLIHERNVEPGSIVVILSPK